MTIRTESKVIDVPRVLQQIARTPPGGTFTSALLCQSLGWGQQRQRTRTAQLCGSLAADGVLENVTPEKRKHRVYRVKNRDELLRLLNAGQNRSAQGVAGFFARLKQQVDAVRAAKQLLDEELAKLVRLLSEG